MERDEKGWNSDNRNPEFDCFTCHAPSILIDALRLKLGRHRYGFNCLLLAFHLYRHLRQRKATKSMHLPAALTSREPTVLIPKRKKRSNHTRGLICVHSSTTDQGDWPLLPIWLIIIVTVVAKYRFLFGLIFPQNCLPQGLRLTKTTVSRYRINRASPPR